MDNEIIINRGDSKTITATFTNASDSSAYDLTGKTVLFTMKTSPTDDSDDSDATINKSYSSGDATGIATFTLLHADTDIAEGIYAYNIRLVSGSTILSTQNGKIKIRTGVTQRIVSN